MAPIPAIFNEAGQITVGTDNSETLSGFAYVIEGAGGIDTYAIDAPGAAFSLSINSVGIGYLRGWIDEVILVNIEILSLNGNTLGIDTSPKGSYVMADRFKNCFTGTMGDEIIISNRERCVDGLGGNDIYSFKANTEDLILAKNSVGLQFVKLAGDTGPQWWTLINIERIALRNGDIDITSAPTASYTVVETGGTHIGTDSSDLIITGNYNNALTTIDGRGGYDTYTVNGYKTDFAVANEGNGVYRLAADTPWGRDERIVTNIERLAFIDQDVEIGTGYTNNAPTDIALTSSGIAENSIGGTVVGTLSATDPDAGSNFTYSLVPGNGTNDADNNLVTISGNQVLVKPGAVINYSVNPVLDLNIQVTDSGSPPLSFTKGVTANVLDIPEDNLLITAPGSGTLNGISFVGTYAFSLDIGNDTVRLDESFIHPALSATPSQLMTIDAGGDNDTFYGNPKDNILILTGINQGTLDGIAFSNVENVDLLGGNNKVYIKPGGQLTGILNGGSGTYYLPPGVPDPTPIHPNPSPTPVPIPLPPVGPNPPGPIEGGFNSFYLNENPNILDLTGPGSGVIDGTSFLNFAAVDMRGGNDTANIAAAGSLIGLLDAGADQDNLNLNDTANTLSLGGDLTGTIMSATGPLTSIANFEVFNLGAGSDTAIVDLNQITAASATSRQSVTINGGTDSGTDTSIDTLELTLTDADINALQTNGTLQALLTYLANPTGLTHTAALANLDLTLTSFESASLTNTLVPLPTTKSYSGDYDFTITSTPTSGRVVATQKVKVGRKTSTVSKIDETFANIQTIDITAGASANIINAQSWSGNSILKGEAGNDCLTGGSGITTYAGGLGADKFRFILKPEFSAPLADHITDFSATQMDKIDISRTAFGISRTTKVGITSVNGSTARDAALAQASLFVYDSSTGELWWNQNGSTAGAGTGGTFAVLDNKPATLLSSSVTLV